MQTKCDIISLLISEQSVEDPTTIVTETFV